MGRGEVRLASPLCGQPAGTLQAPASPCPAHPDPCCRGTETRRPPWTRTRTTQGQRQTRAESARARGARGRRPRAPGGEWHRAPLGPRWAGACAGPDARRGGEDRLPTAGGRFRSRCLPTWSRARSSWERWEPRESGSGTRTGRQGVDFLGKPGSLGPARSSCSRERPSERTCRLSTALPVLSLRFIPPASLPTLSQIFLFCDFSVVLLGLLEAGQPCRKENKLSVR